MTTLALERLRPRIRCREPSAGTSEVARRLRTKFVAIIEDAARSATGEQRISSPIAQLLAGAKESRELSQHGEISAPTEGAIREAISLIESLPAWAPAPTPILEHDGAIGLEWEVGPGRFFLVAVDGTGRVEYSAILGVEGEYYGTTNFTGAMPGDAEALLARSLRR
jgi:hypothetical protein